MIHKVPKYDPDAPILVIDIGNSKINVASWQAGTIKAAVSTPINDLPAFQEAFDAHLDALPEGKIAATVIASVVPETLKEVIAYVETKQEKDALVVGDSIDLPMEVAVQDSKAVGVDRICAAAAAYETLKAGCTVVDFGTAVTVDIVDDDGQFLGGAILPGLAMQFRALQAFTSQLPLVERGLPDTAYGKNTTEAIQTGVCRGLAGAVRNLVEGYATSLNQWPQVVATGGDVEFMLPHCDFLDTAVEHLTLRGIALAYAKHMDQFAG